MGVDLLAVLQLLPRIPMQVLPARSLHLRQRLVFLQIFCLLYNLVADRIQAVVTAEQVQQVESYFLGRHQACIPN